VVVTFGAAGLVDPVDPELTLWALRRRAGRVDAAPPTTSTVIDDRAIVSGKRRSSPRAYNDARAREVWRDVAAGLAARAGVCSCDRVSGLADSCRVHGVIVAAGVGEDSGDVRGGHAGRRGNDPLPHPGVDRLDDQGVPLSEG